MRQPRIRRVERSYYLPVIAGGVNDRVHGICGGDPAPTVNDIATAPTPALNAVNDSLIYGHLPKLLHRR